MSVYQPKWHDWTPKEARVSTDKTDKSPSVSFVSASPGRSEDEFGVDDVANRHGGLLVKWGDAADSVAWFLGSQPPTEPFQLMPGVTILDPVRWWESLRDDVAAGPGTRRDRYGAVKNDLIRLYALFRKRGVVS